MYKKKTPKTVAEETLQQVLDKDIPALYVGGSLEAGGYMFNPDNYEPAEGLFDRDENETQPYNTYEQYLWSKIYVENKTESHAYYTRSQEVISTYEK